MNSPWYSWNLLDWEAENFHGPGHLGPLVTLSPPCLVSEQLLVLLFHPDWLSKLFPSVLLVFTSCNISFKYLLIFDAGAMVQAHTSSLWTPTWKRDGYTFCFFVF